MQPDYVPGSLNPSDGSPLAPLETTPLSEVEGLVARARLAQKAWSELPLETRARHLSDLAKFILEHHQEAAQIMSQETGRSELECTMSELVSLPAAVQTHIKVARDTLRPKKMPISKIEYPGKSAIVELLPRGVVAIIAPWNYPLGNFWKHLFPALLAGNTVVIKPSEYTPRTGAWLWDACQKVLPKDVVALVQGSGEVGAKLVESGIDALTFTGSVATGRKVSARAGELLIPVSAELGGKDAAIVLSDCDLQRTALGIAQWSVHNCGHNCAAIERVFVEDSIADEFVALLGAIFSNLRVNAPNQTFSELGPIQNPAQFKIVDAHVKDASQKGATIVCEGGPTGDGYGWKPTLIDRCTPDMLVATEETFGPVLAIIRVKNEDEAVKLANDSPYGLNGSVWTRDIKKGKALAKRLHVGVALVNNHAITGTMTHLPWTGVKETGSGVASSQWAYHVFTRPRTLFVDKSSAPDPWWIPADEQLQELAEALIERGKGSFMATLKLAGIVSKRVKNINALAKRGTDSKALESKG